jgi:hypothetical protein
MGVLGHSQTETVALRPLRSRSKLRSPLTPTVAPQYLTLLVDSPTRGRTAQARQEILGHASERTTLAIYTHSMRRTHDDSADKIAILAGLAPPANLGNKVETNDSVESQEVSVSDCFAGSPGRNRNHAEKSGNLLSF